MDRGEFIKDGFTVWPAANGGWVVIRVDPERHAFVNAHASFSSFSQMCDWLEDQHEGLVIGEMGRKGARPPETDNSAAQDPRVNEMPVGPYPRGASVIPEVYLTRQYPDAFFDLARSPEKDADDE